MSRKSIISFFAAAVLMLVGTTGCNDKIEDDPYYELSSNVAVSGFSLKRDEHVFSSLDSVFFSIDLDKGVIFNADSLPKGTNIAALIPVISYSPGISSAVIKMTGGKHRTGEVDYMKNPTDSIDFTGRVVLTLTAQNGINTRSYELKVNVHKMDPDSLWWDKVAVAKLPSRLGNPKNQKTVQHDGRIVCLIEESDGSYTISSTEQPNKDAWAVKRVVLPFDPDVRSLASTQKLFYMLDNAGNLYSSQDALTWTSTGNVWKKIIGAYSDAALGIRETPEGLVHTCYPSLNGFEEKRVAEGFPVDNSSNFSTFSSKWTGMPIGILAGGRDLSGKPVDATWGFDGNDWTNISQSLLPQPIQGAVIVPYFMYKKTSTLWITTEYSVWMMIGGLLPDGTVNRKIYISYDNGVNWNEATSNLGMPDYIPGMQNIDHAVVNTPMSGNFEPKVWTDTPSSKISGRYRVKYEIDGYDIKWNCPYIYLFGGYSQSGQLYDTIWKGVINRLTFIPLI